MSRLSTCLACFLFIATSANAESLKKDALQTLFADTCVAHTRSIVTGELLEKVKANPETSEHALDQLKNQVVLYEEGEVEEVSELAFSTASLAIQLEVALEYMEHEDLPTLDKKLHTACSDMQKTYHRLADLESKNN